MSASTAAFSVKPILARADWRPAMQAAKVVAVATAQSAVFAAALWLAVAAPGFLG